VPSCSVVLQRKKRVVLDLVNNTAVWPNECQIVYAHITKFRKVFLK
jgi:hypothetical protein